MKGLVLVLLVCSQSLFAGDLGGGGSLGLRKVEVVDQVTIGELKTSRNLEEAYHKWIDHLTEQQRKQVFEQAFEDYVIPKLEK